MSNLEREPAELVCETGGDASTGPASTASAGTASTSTSTAPAPPPVQILEPREVPLGGPRALLVRRTLPQRERSLIGAWCFVDSYGPTPAARAGVMDTPPHPHTGLQTVSWLYAGEIEHRDSVGSHAMVRPSEVNLMTAGSGIQHSEVSTDEARILHGVQLWIALPDAHRHVAPAFETFAADPVRLDDATLRVFVGTLGRDPDAPLPTVTTYTPLVAAQVDLPAGGTVRIPADPTFEYGLVVDSGTPRFQGTTVASTQLGVVATGASGLVIEADDAPVRALLIGGAPLDEQIVMWWNFVGRSHDEVVAYREQWQHDVIDGADAAGRFGAVAGYDGSALPAPVLPNVRLRPRE